MNIEYISLSFTGDNIKLILFCPEHRVLSLMTALLESSAVQEADIHTQDRTNVHNREQFQEITAVVRRQPATETCCICQASILLNQ